MIIWKMSPETQTRCQLFREVARLGHGAQRRRDNLFRQVAALGRRRPEVRLQWRRRLLVKTRL